MDEATPEVSRGRGISPIWIIPLVALALGIWMVIYTLMREGPDVEIRFSTAEGLEEGKTKVKYRNVQVGVVETVGLSDDREGVLAQVKLDREVTDMLREDTRFWVVTARLGAGSISGLDTLLSGAYIEMSPGHGRTGVREFVALERPPLTPRGTRGLRLSLVSEETHSVSTGDSVLYKGYEVGRVESTEFDPQRQQLRHSIFIDAPFHSLVNSSVRFWDVSGVSVSAGANGIDLRVGSLDTVFFGGVTFGVPPGLSAGEPVQDETEFRLYPSFEAAIDNPYKHGEYFVISFTQSLRGLLPGAPVEYRGIPLGRVERVMLRELVAHGQGGDGRFGSGAAVPVLIYLEPGRLGMPDSADSIDTLDHTIVSGIANGLRATLASGNLVTGNKYISIDYFPDAEPTPSGEFVGYTTIPTVPGGFERIEQQLYALLDKFNQLPLGETVAGANEALAGISTTLESLRVVLDDEKLQALAGRLDRVLDELQTALAGFSPDSAIYRNLSASLADLDRMVQHLEAFSRTIATQPNAAVFGADIPADPVPEARPR